MCALFSHIHIHNFILCKCVWSLNYFKCSLKQVLPLQFLKNCNIKESLHFQSDPKIECLGCVQIVTGKFPVNLEAFSKFNSTLGKCIIQHQKETQILKENQLLDMSAILSSTTKMTGRTFYQQLNLSTKINTTCLLAYHYQIKLTESTKNNSG